MSEEELIAIDLPKIKIAPDAAGTIMNRFEFTNPYSRPIDVEFVEVGSEAGETVQFLPKKITLEAGETSSIRLVQRWGELAPQSVSYSGSLAIGNQSQNFFIATGL